MSENTANTEVRKFAAETGTKQAHLDHLLTDEELARIVGGAGRADFQPFVVSKYIDTVRTN